MSKFELPIGLIAMSLADLNKQFDVFAVMTLAVVGEGKDVAKIRNQSIWLRE